MILMGNGYTNQNVMFFFFGKPCKQRRRICFISRCIKCYKYSNQTMCAQPLSEGLQKVLDLVNEKCGTDFNAILCNKYDNENHYISEHSDNEKGLDNSRVASLSWGATHKFRIRNIATKEKIDIPLTHGLLTRMSGTFQSMYKHGLPVEKKKGERYTDIAYVSQTCCATVDADC